MSLRDYWLREGTPERALALRFAFFGVLALDQWAQLAHLARYGAGNFNVSHLQFLDGVIPVPERGLMVGLVLLQIVLAVRCALGIRLRLSAPLLAGGYAVTYFWSQLDSYQHHYLVVVLVFVFGAAVLLEPSDDTLPPWSLRLVRWILAIMYLYAAIAKMEPAWLDGTTLRSALSSEWGQQAAQSLAQAMGVELLDVLSSGAWAAVGMELVLAVTLLIPRTRTFGWVLGLLFHLSVEVLEFRIGLFSYFMAGLYLLYAPRGMVRAAVRTLQAWLPSPGEANVGATIAGAAVVALAVAWLPLEGALGVGVVAFLLLSWPTLPLRDGLAQGLAAALLVGLAVGTDTLRDYYKYWGGDTRRRGPVDEAIMAYEHVVELDPAYVSGHLRLGDLYLRVGRKDEARAEYEEALIVEPGNSAAQERLEGLGGLP